MLQFSLKERVIHLFDKTYFVLMYFLVFCSLFSFAVYGNLCKNCVINKEERPEAIVRVSLHSYKRHGKQGAYRGSLIDVIAGKCHIDLDSRINVIRIIKRKSGYCTNNEKQYIGEKTNFLLTVICRHGDTIYEHPCIDSLTIKADKSEEFLVKDYLLIYGPALKSYDKVKTKQMAVAGGVFDVKINVKGGEKGKRKKALKALKKAALKVEASQGELVFIVQKGKKSKKKKKKKSKKRKTKKFSALLENDREEEERERKALMDDMKKKKDIIRFDDYLEDGIE